LRNLHHVVGAELPNGIEVPVDFHRRIPLRLTDCPPHRIEFEPPPQNHTGSERDFGICDALPTQRGNHPAGHQRVVFWPAQALRYKLETVQKSHEIGEIPNPVYLFAGQGRVEQDHGFPVYCSFKMQVKLGKRHIIEGLMNVAEMEAVIGGYHHDVFSVLGPHPVDGEATDQRPGSPRKTAKPAWEIRAFLPQARTASVLLDGAELEPDDGTELEMEKLHKDGFFLARLKSEPGVYQFQTEDFEGCVTTIEDPFRFGTIITEFDLHLHSEGTLYEAWKSFGSHPLNLAGVPGVLFAVWAPSAVFVSVAGDFNDWDTRRHPMRRRNAGTWEIFIPGAREGQSYKYLVRANELGHQEMKADPFAFATELPPKSASVIARLDGYEWNDADWMAKRAASQPLKQPMSVYEVHLESWMHSPGGGVLSWRDLSAKLVGYLKRMGYTHVELLPIMEHPYSGSWGYQVTGYFAPTARFGSPDDFKYFVDTCHSEGIGVLVDWVPGHFPKDAHGLARFDGTALYEHADPRQGEHLEWGTLIFNFGRNEVREFLISNALFWLEHYHIDGLRVDAVASMLYLDYCREPGTWIPNRYGGRENLEAIDFLRKFNELVHKVPGAVTIAEESTSFAGVSRPIYTGGLGFTMKWNMGWMHDMLDYFSTDPLYRKGHHSQITFSLIYAFTENFVLPISHDEVVYGKRSLLSKMPGDEWQKFANVRAFLGYMFTHPGKKLLFMGCDIGDPLEWNHHTSVPWQILQQPLHAGLQGYTKELNRLYKDEPALYEVDFNHTGFDWIDFSDVQASVISFIRRAEDPRDYLVIVCNFTPVPRHNYSIGVPDLCYYREILNSDAAGFGGSNLGNGGGVPARPGRQHRMQNHITITLPPLSVLIFKPVRPAGLPEGPAAV
jgi:1,4-alpha-glucan branching enzyme